MKNMKKFIFLFFLLFLFFLVFRCWTVPDVLIFRSEATGNIYLPTFYPPTDVARLKFGAGNPSTLIVQPDSPPLIQADGLSVYRPAPSSRFCQDNKNSCGSGNRGVIVLSGQNKNGPVTSSSYALLTEYSTSLSYLHYLVNKGAPSQRLFIVALDGDKKTIKELDKDGDNFTIDLTGLRVFSFKFMIFSFVSSLIVTVLVAFAVSPTSVSFFKDLFYENKISSICVALWWGVFYICVFPSMFVHDTDIHNANSQIYTDWHSDLYFIYTSCVRILGFDWIQFLPAFLGLLSAFLLLRCGSLAMIGRPVWQKRLLSALTVGLFICNPAIVISMFSQQRYFVVIDVAFFAISLWFYGYFKSLSQQRACSPQTVAAVLLLTGLSWLLRSEYLAVFASAVLFFAGGVIMDCKNKFFLRGRICAISVSVCIILATKIFIGQAVPYFYNYDKTLAQAKYMTVSAIAMSYPYVCRENPDPELVKTLAYFASAQKLCEIGPEAFWWGLVSNKANPQAIPVMREMHRQVFKDVANDWRPFLQYRIGTGRALFDNDIWQMDSRYHRRDIARATGIPIDINTMIPDTFGLIHDHPATRMVNRKMISLYAQVGRHINIMGLAVVVAVSLAALATGWVWFTPLYSLLFMVMIIPIVAVSPTCNWAYLGFLPVWASFVLPLAICEGLISQRYLAFQAPRGRLISVLVQMQQFIRFAALSGAGWVLDTMILLALSHAGHVPPAIANTISSCLAAGLVFLVSRRCIHGGGRTGISGRMGVYVMYTLLLILGASAVLSVLVHSLAGLGLPWLKGERLLLAGKILITPPQLICNFFVSRFVARYTFPSRNH